MPGSVETTILEYQEESSQISPQDLPMILLVDTQILYLCAIDPLYSKVFILYSQNAMLSKVKTNIGFGNDDISSYFLKLALPSIEQSSEKRPTFLRMPNLHHKPSSFKIITRESS